jgi:hypothetical protein
MCGFVLFLYQVEVFDIDVRVVGAELVAFLVRPIRAISRHLHVDAVFAFREARGYVSQTAVGHFAIEIYEQGVDYLVAF